MCVFTGCFLSEEGRKGNAKKKSLNVCFLLAFFGLYFMSSVRWMQGASVA